MFLSDMLNKHTVFILLLNSRDRVNNAQHVGPGHWTLGNTKKKKKSPQIIISDSKNYDICVVQIAISFSYYKCHIIIDIFCQAEGFAF